MRDREKTSFSVEEMEEQVLLDKEWSRSRMRLHRDEMMILKRVFRAQEKALQKLREESEELYQQAIQVNYYYPNEFELVYNKAVCMANNVDSDQMLHSAASDLGLHCLRRPICPNT